MAACMLVVTALTIIAFYRLFSPIPGDRESGEREAMRTPGPWIAHDDDGTGTLPCVLSDKVNAGGNFYVAQCNNFEDAILCASAPELLEACKAVLSDLNFNHRNGKYKNAISDYAGRLLLATIAKAEGK